MMVNDQIMGSLIEQNPDAMIFADTDGKILVWNEAAQRVFGFTKDEAIGETLDIIIPEKLRVPHWRGYDEAIKNRGTKYLGKSMPTKAIHSEGSTIYVELGFSIVLDDKNEVMGVLSSARDITERFKEERAKREKSK
ncbi:PAS domain-containing protein [Marinobacter persicus]|uniref:PAS domain S-box-containing protein n=1 Tax=Marinobacter persicus TaxID=930118 RepID=A0A2S6G4F4_9GAMM|nr:PAS domain S-box protein [Marinobacter persicus]PPK50617.1 PAS domain S-box-containing protein [Marinobacter persicus]PPK53955.1 PAS domain S-box-containing protein [Marinobacter persicus]PPK57126.1 PAS domain S-box-containing protein [Marinobacter persicus]